MITLNSSDGELFEVEESGGAGISNDQEHDRKTILPSVTSKILAKVIEYCKKHVENPSNEDKSVEDELKTWDAEVVKVEQPILFDLILGCKLSEHQEPVGPYMPDSCGHDKRKDYRGNLKDLQQRE
ncbi:hypothetical protein HYC85_030763 [Camellia sinensis]|uniref:SKP1 component POZ domain-containing protein n=1 Tax=Camellia sinensis TaxID=4442 RepID=A0A7J7G1Q3_CAMSI|nr:hypothetical protein HYC85_030763 [Camellia sinensis]